MPKLTTCATAIALLAFSGPTFAQTMNPSTAPATSRTDTATTSSTATPGTPEAVPNHVMPGQLRFTDMNGATVYDRQDANVGDINNVIFGRDGRVAAVVIKTGAVLGIGGKNVAIAMSDLSVRNGSDGKPHFSIDMTKDQLKAAQVYDTSPSATETGSSTPPASDNTRHQ